MKTLLRAPAELFEISVFAEVAVWEKRLELQRLFRAGEARGRVDTAIVASALPGLSDSACRNLLRSLEHMKLIDTSGAITVSGKTCAATGEAPAWELGVFTFLVATHMCFGSWPIGFRRERVDGLDRDFDDLEEVPSWFSASPEWSWTSGFEDKTRFTIARFPARAGNSALCRRSPLPPARLLWEMELSTGKNRLHVEGDIIGSGGKSTPFRTEDRTVPEAEVRAFFASWEPRWSGTVARVLLPYDGAANKDGHDDFLRTLTYRKVTAGARGTFDLANVDGIPVGPPSAPEARDWATALALARVSAADAYVSPKSWAADWDAMLAGTPLHPEAGASPDVSTLLGQRPTLPRRLYWLLAAGTDLAMEC